MANEIRIEGLRELRANLLKLTDRTAKNVLNRAVNAGARIIRDEAKQNAPVDSGKLKRNIITAKRRAPKGSANFVVTVREKGKADDPKNAFYARFLEFGTAKFPAAPFMAPAFENKKREAIQAIGKALGEGIEAEAKKEGVRL